MDNSDDVLKIKYLDENGIVMFYSRLNNRYKIVDSLPDIETVSPVDRHKLFILKEIGTAGARYWPFVIEQDGWHNIGVTKSDIDGKYEKPVGGIPESDLAADVQGALGKADTAVQPNSLSTVASTGNYEDLNNKPELFSGDYNDLSNKPTIPAVDQSYNASSGNAQSGTAVAGALADVRQVPPAQSTDTGKILGVTDATGTVGWVSPQAASQVNADWNATEGVAAILNKPNLAAVATSGSYNDLTDKPSIPSFTQSQEAAINSGVNSTKVNAYDGHVSDSDIHVTTQDKAAWDGKQDAIGDLETIRSGAASGATAYQKPSGGIPSTDLSSAVQDSLGKADTAIQSHQDISGKADKVTSSTSGNFAALDASGNLTDSGSKAADFATSAQGALADSAYQLPVGGMPSTDMSHETQVSLGKADSAYQKPSGGIPDTDLSSGVQASLAKADTALQQHQDISGKVDKISGGTTGNLVALDSAGGISDSGKSLSDLQMKLTAGANITIDPNTNTISAVGGGGGGTTEYTAGPGIIISGTAIGVNAGSNLSIDSTTGVISATDTTYESKTASESGTDVSLVTTGEKYNWNAKYDKPSGGIPKADLASGVQNSLDLADSALQSHQDISGKADKAEMSVVPGTGNDADKTTITLKSGTSATVLTSHQDISGKQDVISDLDTIRAGAADGATAYQKPSGGIPDTDLSSDVQASLSKADTALQTHQDISGKADKVSGATNGNFAGLDSNGNLTDSGSKAADFATAAQGTLADSAYQKPSGGIPDTDLSSAVQTSLGKADTALQSHQDISGKADKVSGAASGNFAALDGNGNLVDSGSKVSDFATAAQGTKADSAVQPGDLATVATSGSYSDLSNKPSIPTVDQSYSSSSTNAQSGTAVASAISGKQDTLAFDGTYDASDNKVATVSTVTNAVSGKADKSEMSVTAGTGTDADKTTIQLKTGLTATVLTAHQDISGKQDTISDLQTIREGASAGATAYQKPSGGIPDTDLSSSVQTSLGKADTALQNHQDISGKADKVSGATNGNFAGLDSNGNLTDSGSKAGDFATAVQGGKADTAVQPGDLATVATSGSYADLSNTPDIPRVDQTYDGTSANAQSGVAVASAISDKADKVSGATNGNFAGLDANGNLTDSGSKAGDFATSAQGAKADSAIQLVKVNGSALTPDANKAVDITVPAAQVKSDWNSSSGLSEILNKPDLSVYALKSEMSVTAGTGTDVDKTTITLKSGTAATVLTAHQDITGKQDVISDLSTIRSGAEAGATAYQKPSGGIPDTDLSSGVQALLGKADTALQSHQDISGKADKVSGATNGNFAGLDSNGNLTDSGSKASDFATAAQGTLADSAYQLPSGGMPSTDMASAVQTSLGKADSAIQGVKVNSTALTPDANHIVDITINNATVTIDMAGTASSPNRSVGSFTVDQSAASTITIPAAVSAIPEVLDQNNEVVTAAVPAQPGVLSSGDKEKLDGLFNVTGSSTIAIDPSTHAVSAIIGPDGGVVAGAGGLIVQPDLVSRVVYVGADCVYNDKTFWSDSTTVDGIIADYANQTVTDYRGNGVPLARFVAEYDSNRYRIANIDETPGTIEYNRKIGGQIIDLMRSDFWMSSHPTYDIIKFDKDMDELFDLLMTGSPMNAYLLLNNMTSTAFITDARREMYMDMIKAYDAWPYADKDTAYADFMAEHALDRFVQVSTSWPLNSWNSYRYVMAGTKTATDKVIFVLRHAERGDDTSVNGDINSTGVTTCTTMGEQVRNNASWSSGGTTYRIDNFPANDATYYSTEYLRCKHSAQAFAEARYDTDFAASDYSGITVEVDMLNQYRFFYQPAESGNSDLIRKYSVNPSQLTSSELSNYFGVSSAAEAQEKLSNDYVRVCKEILNKSTARLNMFYTHDFFTLPLAVMASNKYFDFSGNSSADNRNWINYCAGIGMVLHPDNTYEVMPVRGKSNGSMTI